MDDKTTVLSKECKNGVDIIEKKEIRTEKNGSKNSSQSTGKILDNCSALLGVDLFEYKIINNNELPEASSGFEAVSSVDSNADGEFDDLSSLADEEDYNVVVEIENELAYHNYHRSNLRRHHWRGTNKPLGKCNKRASSDYIDRFDNFRLEGREPKHWRNEFEDIYYKNDRRDRVSSEKEGFGYNRQHRYQDWDKRGEKHGRSRRIDRDYRIRCSESPEPIFECTTSRSSERNTRMKSPGYKDRKKETKNSSSFDGKSTKSDSKRNSPPRKKWRRSSSKSPISSVWKRLGRSKSRSPVFNNRNAYRKRQRTPFLVELERKLQEATRLKSLAAAATKKPREQSEVRNIKETPEMLPSIQNPATVCAPTYAPPPPNIPRLGLPYNYKMPTVSINNLPLVPGQTGIPVHISMTGEQIPHDFDGKPIPIGPNGHYLPLDPTGRLFAHIRSPDNLAVPIHMTEDGVLRLPNSEPVPYGPTHQLPVNIDGRVIPIGPDSKPLSIPYPELPRQPPLNKLKMINSLENTQKGVAQMVHQSPTELQRPNTGNQDIFQTSKTHYVLVDIHNSSQKPNKVDSFNNYRKISEQSPEDMEMGKIFDSNVSKTGIKRSLPTKLSQKKATKCDINTNDPDIILNSADSNCVSGLKSKAQLNKDLDVSEEIDFGSYDEQVILNAICDLGTSQTPSINTNTLFEPNNVIVSRIRHTITALGNRNYHRPVIGRFIVSDPVNPIARKSPYESPLLRNRIVLPFLVPDSKSSHLMKQSRNNKKTEITFKFLPQKAFDKREDSSGGKNPDEGVLKIPTEMIDFSVQCDMVSDIINQLSSKIKELEKEVQRLKNTNSDLLEDYRNSEIMNEQKDDELREAILKIRERKNEIHTFKSSARRRM